MKMIQSQIVVLAIAAILLGVYNPVHAKKAAKKLPSEVEIREHLLKRAEKYAKLYERRKFKDLYDYINVKYRNHVTMDIFEDYITFPGEADKHMIVTVEMWDIMNDITLGKVIFKISTYGKDRIKGTDPTGDEAIGELESEFMETTDWVYENGDWYKMERYDK